MLALFAPEKDVVFFEDGTADYNIERKKWSSIFNGFSDNLQSVIMARLGYFGKGYTWLETTKNTVKYCTIKKELKYTNYKEIREFSLSERELQEEKKCLMKAFPGLKDLYITEDGALAFTIPNDFSYSNWEEYIKMYIERICKDHKKVFMKCHPREDIRIYSFPKETDVTFIPKDIPAELLLPLVDGKECYFMEPDSIVIGMSSGRCTAKILYAERFVQSGFGSVKKMYEYCERFIPGRYVAEKIMD